MELVSPGRNHEVIQEGSEPDEFWNGLGGQGEYSKTLHNLDKPILEPRLFQCLELNGGRFRALEIDDFDQKDLVHDSVLILDSGDEIYIWVGNEASDSDKEKSLELAKVNMIFHVCMILYRSMIYLILSFKIQPKLASKKKNSRTCLQLAISFRVRA